MIGGMYIFERFTKRIDVRIPERVLSRFIFDIPTLMLFKVLKIEILTLTRPNKFGSMTARKDDTSPMKPIFCQKGH